nr:response regulator transcription factor [uncultured Oscillibacter sp.]
MNKPQILFVEDDTAVGNLIATTLETQNYQFHRAKNGRQAVLDALSYRPDVMLLDLGLPDLDGIDIIKKVRSWSNMPIIVVSARSDDRDKVAALDAGADDYLTKPFSVDELLARLRVALRRVRYDSQKTSGEAAHYENGGLVIDYAAGCAYLDGQELHLTPMEYKLLCLLSKNAGKVLTHNYIIGEVWGLTSSNVSAELPSLRVFMATLRKKLEADPAHPRYIQTHIGVGYRMIQHGKGLDQPENPQ